jgi:hypothetical protein
VNCLTRVSLGLGAAGQFLFFWTWFVRIYVGFSFHEGCVLGVFFVPGPREVTEAFWNACCVAAVATGLTSSFHQFDRRRPSA